MRVTGFLRFCQAVWNPFCHTFLWSSKFELSERLANQSMVQRVCFFSPIICTVCIFVRISTLSKEEKHIQAYNTFALVTIWKDLTSFKGHQQLGAKMQKVPNVIANSRRLQHRQHKCSPNKNELKRELIFQARAPGSMCVFSWFFGCVSFSVNGTNSKEIVNWRLKSLFSNRYIITYDPCDGSQPWWMSYPV